MRLQSASVCVRLAKHRGTEDTKVYFFATLPMTKTVGADTQVRPYSVITEFRIKKYPE